MNADTFHEIYTSWKQRAESLDSKLRPIIMQEVDVNVPGWQKQLARRPHPADQSGMRQEIASLFGHIVDLFEKLNVEQRQAVIDLIEENGSLLYSAVIDDGMETLVGFRRNMILLVIANQGKDTRDAIVALDRCREIGLRHGHNVDAVFKQMASIASDHDKYGWGSASKLFKTR